MQVSTPPSVVVEQKCLSATLVAAALKPVAFKAVGLRFVAFVVAIVDRS